MKNKQKRIVEIIRQLNELTFELAGLYNDIELEVQERRAQIHLMSPRLKKPKEGCIIKRKDNRFEGRYVESGRQRSVYAKTYDDCYNALAKAIKLRDETPKIIPITAVDYINEWFEIFKKHDVKDTTYINMYSVFKRLIEPKLETLTIDKITASELKQLITSIEGGRTRETVYNILFGAFKQAVVDRVINYNPMLGVKRINHKRIKGAALTLEEEKDFIKQLDGHKLRDCFLFMLYSGCRRSEVLSICSVDADTKKDVLHISGTKNDKSDRYIPLFDKLKPLLSSLPFEFSADYLSRKFKQLCPAHKLHDLRHTFATRCLEADISLKVVQEWLGHSDIGMTADTYMHVSNELHKHEANKLNSEPEF